MGVGRLEGWRRDYRSLSNVPQLLLAGSRGEMRGILFARCLQTAAARQQLSGDGRINAAAMRRQTKLPGAPSPVFKGRKDVWTGGSEPSEGGTRVGRGRLGL